MSDDATSDWYVSGPHVRRALGYFGAELAERGLLPPDFEQPRLLTLWGNALAATIEPGDRSPIDERMAVVSPGVAERSRLLRAALDELVGAVHDARRRHDAGDPRALESSLLAAAMREAEALLALAELREAERP